MKGWRAPEHTVDDAKEREGGDQALYSDKGICLVTPASIGESDIVKRARRMLNTPRARYSALLVSGTVT